MNETGETQPAGETARIRHAIPAWKWLVAHPVAATALVATPTLAVSIAVAVATLWVHGQSTSGEPEHLHTCTSACRCNRMPTANATMQPRPSATGGNER